ncbi:hypothetical protein HOLleu_15436 [Holothuria leucospilota]|uniref:Fibronectin type-III domain-containing protein n=1 Tax=Holothuria leucospilota TaxID=206669 RepID=A0A9Q1CA98_HOLLE|nr:hypothetical protein HOLleu_15436 [Holothuria leucospilota]
MDASSMLYTCLMVATLLEFASGRYLVDGFPVNLTCLSHVPFSIGTHSFQCKWLPPFNENMGNCSLYFRATDEVSWSFCESVAEWNLCNKVLPDEHVCEVARNHCMFEDIRMMLLCEDHAMNFTSSEFSTLDIVIPEPPTGLHLVATSKGEMNLSWEWPSGWHLDDLHNLQINVKYWQEVGGKQLGMNTIVIQQPSHDILPWDLSGLEYSYVNTCVQMSAVYKSSGHSSNWSAIACNRTQMERPIGKPENITARTLHHDEERGTRNVNVSWTAIPETKQGGPQLYYEVKIDLFERQAVYNVSECFYEFKELNTTDVYHIHVTACNVVGRSTTHEIYVLDRLENPTKVSATSRNGMIIGVILFLTVIIIVIISSLLVLKRKLNSGSDIEWKLNVKVSDKSVSDLDIFKVLDKSVSDLDIFKVLDKSDLSQGNVFETEKEVFDKLWEKKELNNNENIQSGDGIEGKLFQEEEYQPFIIVKNGWTANSQCKILQASNTGYVGAGGKDMSGGKRDADMKSEYVSDGKVAGDLKSACVFVGKLDVDLKCGYVSDGKRDTDLKSEYVSDGKVAVDLKPEYVSDGKVAVGLKSEYVSDGKVGLKSEYVPDGNMSVDLKSEYVSDDKMAVGLKYVDGNSSCKHVAGDLEHPYIQL